VLETFERDFRPDQVVPGATALLNLLPEIPQGPLGIRTRQDGGRATGNPSAVEVVARRGGSEAAVEHVLPNLRPLTAKC
jgi:hypothetical protein